MYDVYVKKDYDTYQILDFEHDNSNGIVSGVYIWTIPENEFDARLIAVFNGQLPHFMDRLLNDYPSPQYADINSQEWFAFQSQVQNGEWTELEAFIGVEREAHRLNYR